MNADRILLGAILVVLIFIGLKLHAIERQLPGDPVGTQLRSDVDQLQRDVRAIGRKLGADVPPVRSEPPEDPCNPVNGNPIICGMSRPASPR